MATIARAPCPLHYQIGSVPFLLSCPSSFSLRTVRPPLRNPMFSSDICFGGIIKLDELAKPYVKAAAAAGDSVPRAPRKRGPKFKATELLAMMMASNNIEQIADKHSSSVTVEFLRLTSSYMCRLQDKEYDEAIILDTREVKSGSRIDREHLISWREIPISSTSWELESTLKKFPCFLVAGISSQRQVSEEEKADILNKLEAILQVASRGKESYLRPENALLRKLLFANHHKERSLLISSNLKYFHQGSYFFQLLDEMKDEIETIRHNPLRKKGPQRLEFRILEKLRTIEKEVLEAMRTNVQKSDFKYSSGYQTLWKEYKRF